MPSASGRDKDLPVIPVHIDASGTVVEDDRLCTVPSSKITTYASTNKALPSVNAEKTLTEEEMIRLHELWNGAGLSARAHRRRHRDQQPTRRPIPAPISIPEPGTVTPTLQVASTVPSATSTTPPSTATRKRRGFLSARPFSETQEVEKKSPGALEKLRAMAQDRLKKKLRCAKSAPNLGDQAASFRRGGTFQPAVPIPVGAAPKEIGSSSSRYPASPGKLLTPEAVLQQEDTDENAIYFTVDPNWRASRGSAELEPITAIPDSPVSSGRPDSPLLHRHYSLDQRSFAGVHVTNTLSAMEYPSGDVLHPIDELHAYLEL